jgi:uncharacterized protein (TIGR02147 family)
MIQPSVFSYRIYRSYLKDFYRVKKATCTGYSYRRFSLEGGIASPNFLKLVMDGKKNLTTATILKFAKALDLGAEETFHFEAMVLENQATDAEEKRYYGARLRKASDNPRPRRVNIGARTQLFDHPLFPAAVVLLAGAQADTDLEGLCKRIDLPYSLMSGFLKVMETEQVLSVTGGRYEVNFEHAIFARRVSDIKLKEYVRRQLELTTKAFQRSYEREGSKFLCHTIGVSRERIPEIEAYLDNSIAELNEKFTCEPAEDVMQINLQSFLISARRRKG